MVLYARSDVMHLSLGVHGCGASHSREVTRGVAAREFKLDCPPCEAYLRGDRKPKKLVYETDKRTGQPVRQARVADADPLWTASPDALPLTPDEERINGVRQERGAQQIQMIQALAALRGTGADIPADAMWLLERELPAELLRGTVVCANGHDNQAGLKFCGECGISMSARAAIGSGSDEGEAGVPLDRLHVATLRKRCRDAGLPDKGSKDVLIGRLQAA
jgi:hypothetical protein